MLTHSNDFGTKVGDTVDYMFHSPGLVVARLLLLLEREEIEHMGGLPGPNLPSDHQPIMACYHWA